MEFFLGMLVGLAIGVLLTAFWVAIREQLKASKNLRQSYAKARKEIIEKQQKAKTDQTKARLTQTRVVLQLLLFAATLLVIGFGVWLFLR